MTTYEDQFDQYRIEMSVDNSGAVSEFKAFEQDRCVLAITIEPPFRPEDTYAWTRGLLYMVGRAT